MFSEATEVDIVTWFQDLPGVLEAPMLFFTWLGFPIIYIVLVPVVYWCLGARLGLRLALFLFAGGLLNDIAKLGLRSPRPYWVSADVEAFRAPSGAFGMPSGHSQVTAPAWAMLVWGIGRRWAVVAGVALAALIGVSRIYLGAHFPSQVLVGLVIGFALLAGMNVIERHQLGRLIARSTRQQLGLIVALTALVTAVGYLLVAAGGSWRPPTAWIDNYVGRAGAGEALEPVEDHGLAFSAGSLLGTAIGAVLQRRFVGWRGGGSVLDRLRRIPLGALSIAVPAAAVSAVFAGIGIDVDDGAGAEVFGAFLTFALFVGVFLLAPALFVRFLARDRAEADGRLGRGSEVADVRPSR